MLKLFPIIISLFTILTIRAASLPVGIHEFPPFVSNTLRSNGLLGFYVNHIFKDAGVDIKMNSYRRGRLFNEIANSGKYFGIFPVISNISSEDQELSKPLISAHYVFIHRKGLDVDKINFKSLEGFEKFKLGVLISDSPYEDLKVLDKIKLSTFQSAKELVMKLSNRSVDIIVFERIAWNYLSNANNVQNLDEYVMVEGPWNSFPVYMLVSKKYPEYKKYLEILNKGTSKFDLNKIISEHFY